MRSPPAVGWPGDIQANQKKERALVLLAPYLHSRPVCTWQSAAEMTGFTDAP